MSRRFLARAQASDVRECGCHVTTSHASITAENYRKKQGQGLFFCCLYWVCQYPGCQRGFFYETVSTVVFIIGVSREELYSRGSLSKDLSIKRDGLVLKVDMTKQFVSAV